MTDSTSGRPDDITSMASEPLPGADSAASEAERVAALVEQLAREASENKDKLLRSLAEMENMRRRTDRQVADAREYGITAFARDVLAVADNMNRALSAIDPQLRETADAGLKSLLEGVELTERELLNVLEKHGVKRFEPTGEKFDPNLHQAMYEVPDSSLPNGSVAKVVQAGYMIGDRVLRPALVGVAKARPKPPPAPPPQELAAKAEEPAEGLADEHVETSANDNTGEPAPDIVDEQDILDIPNPLRSPKSRPT
ncbi:MAG TPA: nucleotide exchange factor GrpE [Burkholderiales bacterium]|nr:nucleotide exchange factor GrpE [Burkholderiales bacterium]